MIFGISILFVFVSILTRYTLATTNTDNIDDFYTFHVKDSRGTSLSLEKYRGKVSLVTNVATECGYTDIHYEAYVKMQTIFNKYRNLFNVLAFPCNQFGQQEPGPIEYIQKVTKEKYKVNFPIFDKTDVVGEHAPKVWKFLANKSGNEPTWNFWKYLISPNGKIIEAWGPRADLQKVYQTIKKHVEELNGEPIKDEL